MVVVGTHKVAQAMMRRPRPVPDDEHVAFPDDEPTPARPHLTVVRGGRRPAMLPSVPFWQTFLTSPGFGGAAAVLAAVIAYFGIRYRAGQDKTIAATKAGTDAEAAIASDSLQRWWDVAMWLWQNYAQLSMEARITVLESLEDSMVHEAQGGILSAVTEVVLREFEEAE